MDYLKNLNPFAWGSSPVATSEIAELRVYPIKSCRGISVPEAQLTRQGLEFDRRWMIADKSENNKFQTIRQIAEMTLIDTALVQPDSDSDELMLNISIHGQPERRISIPARPSTQWLSEHTHHERVNIWGIDTDGYVYNDEYNAIFREFLRNDNLVLVYKGEEQRILKSNGAPELLGRTESTNFPDVMPVLVANRTSLLELNTRLKQHTGKEITIERFRPNIIVKGDDEHMPAWSEDNWKLVKIDDRLEVDVAARCGRCQVPNVDPETAVKDAKQPWDTLMKYRRVDPGLKWKPCFGMLSCPRAEGNLSVGMKFDVLQTTTEHKFISPG